MPTKLERMTQALEASKQRIAQEKQKAKEAAAFVRAAEEKLLKQRKMLIGDLAYDTGIAHWDDTTLIGVFSVLRKLMDTPDPVKILDGLLQNIAPGCDTETLSQLENIPTRVSQSVYANGRV